MADAAVKEKPPAEAEQELTDGFHLIIDAFKLNGVDTIYGVPGIPITDFGRMAQAEGIRVLSFDPGDMDTPLHALALPDADPSTLRDPDTAAAELVEMIAARVRPWELEHTR